MFAFNDWFIYTALNWRWPVREREWYWESILLERRQSATTSAGSQSLQRLGGVCCPFCSSRPWSHVWVDGRSPVIATVSEERYAMSVMCPLMTAFASYCWSWESPFLCDKICFRVLSNMLMFVWHVFIIWKVICPRFVAKFPHKKTENFTWRWFPTILLNTRQVFFAFFLLYNANALFFVCSCWSLHVVWL